jgi:phosphatidylglycerol:prolipoprotein diacylglycerol transferase
VRQTLFRIPGLGLPIYGYGVMLCLALFACGWYAARRARKQGLNGELMWDLLVWMVIPGIATCRLFYVIQYGVIGGLAGLLLFTRKHKLRVLWLLDLIAPVIGIGLAFGRVGCLLNGCCYGDYCQQPWAIQFPARSPTHQRLVHRELQSPLGFVIDAQNMRVVLVEPGTSAAEKGIRVGDKVLALQDQPMSSASQLSDFFGQVNAAIFESQSPNNLWPLKVSAQRGESGSEYTVYLEAPVTLPVHPTQLYSAINGVVLFFVLASFYPFRRRDGQVIAAFAMLYAVARFLVEYLRYDELPFQFDGLTISQNISILMFTAGLGLLLYTVRRPAAVDGVSLQVQGA